MDAEQMDFVAIDFETANETRSSACSVGICLFKGGEIVDEYYTLIKPPGNRFSPFNVQIHGITPDDVREKPAFPDVWPRLSELLHNGSCVAHNASFDMSVLCQTLAEYGMPFPNLTFNCTRLIAKRTWPGLISYRLGTLAQSLGIVAPDHHALHDARACGQLAKLACQEIGVSSLDELVTKLDIQHGRILQGDISRTGHAISSRIVAARCHDAQRIKVDEIRPSTHNFDPSHPFFEKVFAFTGTLDSMPRRVAMQRVVDVGGVVGNGVTKDTNFLVVGELDYRTLASGETKSAKMRKAEALLAKGQDLEILSEADFLQLLVS